jgi:hypothetical protein
LVGLGVGALLPEGSFADFNDPSYFVQSRSLYVEKIFGGRAAAYYGDTKGSNGADGGRVYGFDFDALVKFGSATTIRLRVRWSGIRNADLHGGRIYSRVDRAARGL